MRRSATSPRLPHGDEGAEGADNDGVAEGAFEDGAWRVCCWRPVLGDTWRTCFSFSGASRFCGLLCGPADGGSSSPLPLKLQGFERQSSASDLLKSSSVKLPMRRDVEVAGGVVAELVAATDSR